MPTAMSWKEGDDGSRYRSRYSRQVGPWNAAAVSKASLVVACARDKVYRAADVLFATKQTDIIIYYFSG